VDIVVDRQGGSLITQYVQYTVHPNGGAEFYGYTNVLKFNPGVMTMSAALLPIADGVPEVCTLKFTQFSSLCQVKRTISIFSPQWFP
jgi:hypothetical protein